MNSLPSHELSQLDKERDSFHESCAQQKFFMCTPQFFFFSCGLVWNLQSL